MSDVKQLERELRRSLHAAAERLVVEDRGFDAGSESVVDLDDLAGEHRRGRGRWIALAAAAVVVAAVAIAVAVRSTGTNDVRVGDSSTTVVSTTTTTPVPVGPVPSRPAPAALVERVTSVPADVLHAVGTGTVHTYPDSLTGPTLSAGDKPRVVWFGAEYCPYCAAQRWPLIVALSRFGTFSGLRVTSSAVATGVGSPEPFPNTQTFSFHRSTYTSNYLEFEAVEEEDNAYQPLDAPTSEQQALMDKYDAPPFFSGASAGSIPFVDFANRFLASGASYDVAVLQGKSADEIANVLSDPTNPIAKAVDGTANVITAKLCILTNDLPASVCSDPAIVGLAHPTGPTGVG